MQQAAVPEPRGERAQRLVVLLPPRGPWGGARTGIDAALALRYRVYWANGSTGSGRATLRDLPRARACELVFSALDVFTGTVQVPRLTDAKLRQALPNLLEERMLGDPLDHHFAFRRAGRGRPASTEVEVAAIARSTLDRALEAFAQLRQPVTLATTQLHALPAPAAGSLGASVQDGLGVVRTSASGACAFELSAAVPGALLLACRPSGASRLRVFGEAATLPAWPELGLALHDEGRDFDDDALSSALNLLQGSYTAPGSDPLSRAVESLRRSGSWRAPAAWAGAALLVCLFGLNALWWQRESQLRAVRQQMLQSFRDAVPEEPPTGYVLEQARRVAGSLRARSGGHSPQDFLALEAQAERLLAQAPAGAVAGLDYGDGAFRLRFRPGTLDNPAQRDSLHAQARRLGLGLSFEADGSARLGAEPAESRSAP
jgi:general secretion pathway protein L